MTPHRPAAPSAPRSATDLVEDLTNIGPGLPHAADTVTPAGPGFVTGEGVGKGRESQPLNPPPTGQPMTTAQAERLRQEL